MEENQNKIIYVPIKHSRVADILSAGYPTLFRGKSGVGKSAHIYKYAEEHNLKVINMDAAGRLPEEFGGIPVIINTSKIAWWKFTRNVVIALYELFKVFKKTDFLDRLKIKLDELEKSIKETEDESKYYTKAMQKELKEFFDAEGKGYLLFFDEITQATSEVLNTLYSIAHPDADQRRWGNHPIPYAQIVACTNYSDGTDGNVYLTELPFPLLERFKKFDLIPDRNETRDYLIERFENVPNVKALVDAMLDEDVSPRNMSQVLEMIGYKHPIELVQSVVGEELTAKLYNLQEKIAQIDPAKALKVGKLAVMQFRDAGRVTFGEEEITTEEELIKHLQTILSDEEIKGIMDEKGEK